MLIGSLIHDIGCLRSIFGVPRRVVSADLWLNGRGFTTVLAYPNGVRCVATWVDLPDLWDFQESLEVYGSASRVIITFPTGFSRGLPTTIALQGSDGGIPWRKEIVRSRDPGFTFELEHFHQCITTGTQPLTTIEGARADAALVREIILTARRQREEA
jgi:predicted dehydrogenase